MNGYDQVTQICLDVHRTFSKLTGRDGKGKVVLRERVERRDRMAMHRQLKRFASGTPVVLEGTFGWGWLSDDLTAAQLRPHLAHSYKVAKWRQAGGVAKEPSGGCGFVERALESRPRR